MALTKIPFPSDLTTTTRPPRESGAGKEGKVSDLSRMRDRYKDISRVSKRWQLTVVVNGEPQHAKILQTLEYTINTITIRLALNKGETISFIVKELSDTELQDYYAKRPIITRKKKA
jgi:hypothetical protein